MYDDVTDHIDTNRGNIYELSFLTRFLFFLTFITVRYDALVALVALVALDQLRSAISGHPLGLKGVPNNIFFKLREY